MWLASAFYKNLIPKERIRRKGDFCNEKTICEEHTCCLKRAEVARRCKPMGKRGGYCSPRALTNVYFGLCPCDTNQGTCEGGICT
uniref:Ixodegrin B n=1 Tax=Rhipicephalus appendiculatus TaxID=34631 RepID=A0A131Z297_RHIAP